MGLEANPHNFLLMHAMGPNVAGVIGSAVAAGVMITLVGQGHFAHGGGRLFGTLRLNQPARP
jgi:hypothetical protein